MKYSGRNLNLSRILKELGVDIGDSRSDNVSLNCPIHNDKHPSFSINRHDGRWICFSKCGGGSIENLVEAVLGMSPPQAHHWLLSYTDGSTVQLEKLLHPPPQEPELIETLDLDNLQKGVCPDWFAKRGFDASDMDIWSIYYEPRTDAIVIPISNGFVKRFPPGAFIRYYYSKGLNKKQQLFGYYRMIRQTRPIDCMLLTEGSLDTMWVVKAGFDAAAILGSSISDSQVQRIALLNPKEVVLAFDNDDAGRKVARTADRKMSQKFNLQCIQLPDDTKDVQELSINQLQSIINQRTPVLSAKLNKLSYWRN